MTEGLQGQGLESDVRRIVDRGFEDMFDAFDRLRGVEPADILRVLNAQGDVDVADQYEDWLGDDAPRKPETDPSIGGGEVPDPANSPSYDALAEHLRSVSEARKLAMKPGALVRYWRGARQGVGAVSRTSSSVHYIGGTPVVCIHGTTGAIAISHVDLIEDAPEKKEVPATGTTVDCGPQTVEESSSSSADCGGGGGE